jgi:LmbE family N-acetylglucosaminyl deacetylase
MQFKQQNAQIFVPEGLSPETALARTMHMAIGAHQDDLEIMAIDGILTCFQQPDQWFTGVVVTKGSGSARTGIYAGYTDKQMEQVRALEQKKAAIVGEYSALVLLDFPSAAAKDPGNEDPVRDIARLLAVARPRVVYTHNLADKHDTHLGVTVKTIAALRSLPESERPQHVYGCEVWRDLDWMVDVDKVTFDVSRQEGLQLALLGVFDSQITGGKRYDLATMGRRRAHATYYESHLTDATTGLVFAMDLTPLVQDPARDVRTYVGEYIERFRDDVERRVARMLG